MTMTLEESFAQAAEKVNSTLAREAETWAAWLMLAKLEIMPANDALAPEEWKHDYWNDKQKNLLRYLIEAKEEAQYQAVKDLLTDIGNVDDIWHVCYDHICYMYGCCAIPEEKLDHFLELCKEDDCHINGISLYAYQWAVFERPLEVPDTLIMARTSMIWRYISQVEQALAPYIKLFGEYEVKLAV